MIGGILLPGTISDRVSSAYDRLLFNGKKLSDLTDDASGKVPRFVFNATNVQTAALWRFYRELSAGRSHGMLLGHPHKLLGLQTD